MLFVLPTPPCQIAQAQVAEVPFALEGYLIVVEGKINGKPAKLILDTGAGLGLFTPKTAAKLELKSIGKANIGGGGEKAAQADLTLVQTIEIGGALQRQQMGIILELPSGAKADFDGIVGYPFLKNYVVQIDYLAKKVRFLTPEQFSPDPKASVLPMSLRMNVPEIPVRIDGLAGKVWVDTGYSGALTFTSPTVEKNVLAAKYPKRVETVLGQGLGGVTKGQMTRIGALELGDVSLPGVITGLSRDKSGALADSEIIALLGGEVLSRFTVTLDYPSKRFFLTKNADFAKPFVYSRAGLSGVMDGDGYRVLTVAPESPAAEVGIKQDEQILTLDGTPVGQLGLPGLRESLRREVGTKVTATIRATDGQTRTVVLILRDLL